MKIAIIAHNLYPIKEPYAGGLEKITHILVDELHDMGYEVTTYAKVGSLVKGELVTFPEIEDFNEVFGSEEHQWLGMSKEEMFQTYLYNWALSDIKSRDFDIIHNHSLHYVPIVGSSLFGEKFITTFHTPIFAHLKYGLEAIKSSYSSTFTSISAFQQKLYQEFVESTVVYNGIDVSNWEYSIEEKEDYLYWMGRICPEKAPHHAMEACIQSNKKLILAGPISNEEYYKEFVEPLLDNENIEYVGHILQTEINNYLKNAKAYLFTSRWDEPYGLTLAESLACGTPVIAYDVGAASEILTTKTGIIIPKGDIPKLIEAIDSVGTLSYKDCRERAVQFCDIKQMVNGYNELYKRIHENSILRTSSRIGSL